MCIEKKIENRSSNRYSYTYAHSNAIHNSWKVEKTQVSIDGWKDENIVVYTYNGLRFNLRKKGLLTQAITWMNLEDIGSEISQWQKNEYYMIPLICSA